MGKLKTWWRRLKNGILTADPDPAASEQGSPLVPPADPEFVLRLKDGTFYASMTAGQMVSTSRIEQAAHFSNRYLAVIVAAQGIQFDGAAIIPCPPSPHGRGEPLGRK